MTKTTALKTAKQHVYLTRMGSGWIVVGPHDPNNLGGAVRESRQMDYWQARFNRTQEVCWLALWLMGYRNHADIYWALDNGHANINDMMDGAMDKLGKLTKVAA